MSDFLNPDYAIKIARENYNGLSLLNAARSLEADGQNELARAVFSLASVELPRENLSINKELTNKYYILSSEEFDLFCSALILFLSFSVILYTFKKYKQCLYFGLCLSIVLTTLLAYDALVKETYYAVTLKNKTFAFSTKDANSQAIKAFGKGEILEITSKSRNWVKVELNENRQAWLKEEDILYEKSPN